MKSQSSAFAAEKSMTYHQHNLCFRCCIAKCWCIDAHLISAFSSLSFWLSLCVLVGTTCSGGTKYSCAQWGAEVAGATFLQLEPRLENWQQQGKGTLVNFQVINNNCVYFPFVKTCHFFSTSIKKNFLSHTNWYLIKLIFHLLVYAVMVMFVFLGNN